MQKSNYYDDDGDDDDNYYDGLLQIEAKVSATDFRSIFLQVHTNFNQVSSCSFLLYYFWLDSDKS